MKLASLCLDLATEAELESVAECPAETPERRHQARAILLQRAQHLARIAARDLQATLHRIQKQSPVKSPSPGY